MMEVIYRQLIAYVPWIIVLLGGAMSSRNICDFSLCVSSELKRATIKNDKNVVCRQLVPTLKCMEGQLPSCHKTMGRFSTIDHQYEQMYHRLKQKYKTQCKNMHGHHTGHHDTSKCAQFLQCLKPDFQQIAYQDDIGALCDATPRVIECFEDALHECKKEVGKANYRKIEQLEGKLEEMRKKTLTACGSSASCLTTSHVLWVVVLGVTSFRFLQDAILS